MAQLIHLRQRIKAIETIKKITHAMRLISMSMHSRLRSKAPLLEDYQHELLRMFTSIQHGTPDWKHSYTLHANPHAPKLVILIGSQKGLCGNFNIALFNYFKETTQQSPVHIIAVGKKATEFARTHEHVVVGSYPTLTTSTINDVAQKVSQTILQTSGSYSQVIVISNVLKTFFLQRPTTTSLLPLATKEEHATETEEYLWQEDSRQFLDALANQVLESTVQQMLFQSLLAEQAARFLSMDSSTRNAKKLLEATTLQYNKLRQANITKELTELSSSF